MCCVLILYRSFTQPNPPGRVVLDAVSSLTTALIKSLKLGCVRGCKFNVCFCRDAFNFLFNNCGSSVRRRPGKLFNRSDFNSVYFCDSNFVFCNDSKEGFCVDFPIYMYSSVKFVTLGCNTYDFVVSLSVVFVKKCY